MDRPSPVAQFVLLSLLPQAVAEDAQDFGRALHAAAAVGQGAADVFFLRLGEGHTPGDLEGVVGLGGAASGKEAIAMWKRVKPDVTLLDIRTPQMGGMHVLEALRRRRATVIMLTGYGEIEMAVRAMQLGLIAASAGIGTLIGGGFQEQRPPPLLIPVPLRTAP